MYRLGKQELLNTLEQWNQLLPGRGPIHLIACGGTALTLLGYKESTKDVDFVVPEPSEYERLIRFLETAGYKQNYGLFGWTRSGDGVVYDLYRGKCVYTTELLDSPLTKNGNRKVAEFSKIYLGVLNSIDLIISKMFRGTSVDRQDCVALAEREHIDLKLLEVRFRETAKYEINEDKVLKNLKVLLDDLKQIKGKRKK